MSSTARSEALAYHEALPLPVDIRPVRTARRARSMGSMTPPPRPAVTLLTRPGCHLCEAARESVDRVASALGLEWEDVDVDTDPELARRHAEEIPVVLVDGVPRDFWQIDERRLARLLRERLAG